MASYFGSASNPADTGSLTATTPASVTPPLWMVAGQLVVVYVQYRAGAAAPAVDVTGGQTWTTGGFRSGNSQTSNLFWCVYNGSWTADPSFSNAGAAPVTVVMHVFHPTTGYAWSTTPDVAQASASVAAPSTPFDCTITGFTTVSERTVSLFFWSSVDDNTWALQTGGFTNAGLAQYRNDSAQDLSNSAAYLIQTSVGATGNVTNRQATNGGDNYHTHSIAFAESFVGGVNPRLMLLGVG
jgi:hypothetical protein